MTYPSTQNTLTPVCNTHYFVRLVSSLCCYLHKMKETKKWHTAYVWLVRSDPFWEQNTPCLGRASASLRRLVRLSAPNWLRIEGSISVSCLVSAWPVMVKVLAASEACTLGLLKWITVPWFVNMFTCKATAWQLKEQNRKISFHS